MKGTRSNGRMLMVENPAAAGRNGRIDAFRWIAAILILAIHTSPLASYSELADFVLTRIAARVGVPFFFMVTGYYVLPRCLGQKKEEFVLYEKKILLLYGVSILLYLPVNWYAGKLTGEFWKAGNLVQELVFTGSFYHLWYLPGLILGFALVYLMGKYVSYGTGLLITLLLYGIGLGGDSYYGLVSQWGPAKIFYEWIFAVSPYTRNGIFFAPVFLWMGYGMARLRFERMTFCKTGFFLSSFLLLCEGLWLHANAWQRHDSMYLFLLPVLFFLFCMLLEKPAGKGRSVPGANWTTWVYLLHPIGIILVRGAARVLKLSVLVENSLVHFLAAAAVSIFMAASVCVFLKKWKEIKRGR